MIIRKYFRFEIEGSERLHAWLRYLEPVVDEAVDEAVRLVARCGWKEDEEILVYLHYMYHYRFSLPAIEAIVGLRRTEKARQYSGFLLRACLMGRFLDDLIDCDSGFWTTARASYLYSHFLLACEDWREGLAADANGRDSWEASIRRASRGSGTLFKECSTTRALHLPAKPALPLRRYPDRIPYYFWIFGQCPITEERRKWIRRYVSVLFYLYDLDDVLNDLHRNVPTDPAHEVLAASLDSEGRIKLIQMMQKGTLEDMLKRAFHKLGRCESEGRRIGLELGPAMIASQLKTLRQ